MTCILDMPYGYLAADEMLVSAYLFVGIYHYLYQSRGYRSSVRYVPVVDMHPWVHSSGVGLAVIVKGFADDVVDDYCG